MARSFLTSFIFLCLVSLDSVLQETAVPQMLQKPVSVSTKLLQPGHETTLFKAEPHSSQNVESSSNCLLQFLHNNKISSPQVKSFYIITYKICKCNKFCHL